MPDITLCLNDKCTIANTCKRSQKSGTVFTPMKQSVSIFYQDESGNCDYFKDVKDWRRNK